MRRKEYEITDPFTIESIILKSQICRLGLNDEPVPYIVPVSFGYKENAIYIHSSYIGKKTELIKKNPNVSFEMDICTGIDRSDDVCNWGVKYESIIGSGIAEFIECMELKKEALDIIIANYSDKTFPYNPKAVERTAIIKIVIKEITCKKSV